MKHHAYILLLILSCHTFSAELNMEGWIKKHQDNSRIVHERKYVFNNSIIKTEVVQQIYQEKWSWTQNINIEAGDKKSNICWLSGRHDHKETLKWHIFPGVPCHIEMGVCEADNGELSTGQQYIEIIGDDDSSIDILLKREKNGIFVLAGKEAENVIAPNPPEQKVVQWATEAPIWNVTCAPHGYKGAITGSWIVMVNKEDVNIKDGQINYEIPTGTLVSGMRDGKGQTLGIYYKEYEKDISTDVGVLDFFRTLLGDDVNRLGGIDDTKIIIITNTIDVNGVGSVVANLEFRKGFGEARQNESPLGSIFFSCRKEQPLLAIFGINYGIIDDKRKRLPLVYPSEYKETASLFSPTAP